MDYNLLIDKSQQLTKNLDILQDKIDINDREEFIISMINDLKYIELELQREKFKIIGYKREEKAKTQFNNIQKIHAIQEYFIRYENREISTQVAECYLNYFEFYVNILPQDIPDFEGVYDLGSCYIKPIL